jgi:chromosome segregation ATPase
LPPTDFTLPVSQPISPAPVVPISSLIQDMGSNDVKIAKEAAYRLIRRQDTVLAIVEAYDSNETMKARALWCLKNMGETTRSWLNKVLSNPEQYRPSLVFAAKNIADELGGNFSMPEYKNEEIIAKINELKTSLANKEFEYNQLFTELKKQIKELSEATIRLETSAKIALRTHNRQDAFYVVHFKVYVEELKENVSKLSDKIALLEEEIRRLRAMSYQPKVMYYQPRTMSCPP